MFTSEFPAFSSQMSLDSYMSGFLLKASLQDAFFLVSDSAHGLLQPLLGHGQFTRGLSNMFFQCFASWHAKLFSNMTKTTEINWE